MSTVDVHSGKVTQVQPAAGNAEDVESPVISPARTTKPFTRQTIIRYIRGLFYKKTLVETTNEAVFELLNPSRYKPHDLEQMSLETKFSKSEVKFLYRAFKTECPNGIIDEDTFKEVYEKIFPMGDASKYAQIVFRAIDRDRTGGITFGDFMDFLSIISKGSEQEKILWSFQFFDVNQDGKITREEMIKVSESVYELMGADLSQKGKLAYVENVFSNMDRNRDGSVSVQEFTAYCNRTDQISSSLLVLP